MNRATRSLLVIVVVAAATMLSGCDKKKDKDKSEEDAKTEGGDKSNELVVNAPDAKLKDHKVSVVKGEFTTLIHSVPGKQGSSYRFYLSDGPVKENEHLPPKAAEDKTLVYVAITGPENDTEKPLPTGTYVPKKEMGSKGYDHKRDQFDVFMKVGDLEITPPKASGKKMDVSDFEGTVEITKSTADEVEGTLDLKKGELSVKGKFKAKKSK